MRPYVLKIPLLRILLLFSVVVLPALHGQNISNIPGAFANIGYGARPMGMGGAFTAVCDDPNASFWNPAAMHRNRFPGLSLMYTRQMSLIPYYYMAYSQALDEQQSAGGAVLYNGDDVYSEFMLQASYSYHIGRLLPEILTDLYAGMQSQYRYSGYGNNSNGGIGQISGSANGFGINLGLFMPVSSRLAAGLVWRDFMDYMNWNAESAGLNYSNTYSEDIPAELVAGLAFYPQRKLLLALDYSIALHADRHDRISLGAEQEFFRFLKARFGMSQNLFSSNSEINRQFSVGLGIEPEFANSPFGVSFNFAYQFTEINPSLRFGMDLHWNVVHEKPLPPRAVIVAEPDTILPGKETRLKWMVRGAGLITIEPGIGRVDSTGSLTVRPELSTRYKITAIGPGGNSTYRTTVTVLREIPRPVLEVAVVPERVREGEKAQLIWNSKNALKVTIKGIGEVGLSGKLPVIPAGSRDYYFSAFGAGGKSEAVTHVEVVSPSSTNRSFTLSSVRFESNSAELLPEAFDVLNKLAKTLAVHENIRLEIRGYTDKSGNEKTNLRLSKMRAESVKAYLVSLGINAKRLIARGFGSADPVAPNDTPQNRAKNRRIEFHRLD